VAWVWPVRSLRPLHGPLQRAFLSTAARPVTMLGIADDGNSSFMRGPAQAPQVIRAAMRSDSANDYCELGLSVSSSIDDAGDLPGGVTHARVVEAVHKILDAGSAPLVLGGDHAVSFPVVKALIERDPVRPLRILHFDAHTDTYDSLDGNGFSHACPFARACEMTPRPRLLQVGIRTLTPALRAQAERFGIRMVQCRDFPETRAQLRQTISEWLSDDGDGAEDEDVPTTAREAQAVGRADVYISVDLDALDPAYAPGVSHHEPGGLSTRQLLAALHTLAELPVCIVGCDLVEYNPARDVNGMTAMVAAKVAKELVGVMCVTRGIDATEPTAS